MNYQHGLFSWADVSTPDPAAGAAFYATLFGWAAEEQHDPDGNYIYTMFSRDGKATAGLGPQPEQMKEQNLPSAWNSYVIHDDVDAALDRWAAAGGTAMMPAIDVMTLGRMAIVVDPEGAVVALWQEGDHAGAGVFNEPGALTWNELNTRDAAAAREFYGKALGWEFEPFEGSEPVYWLIKLADKSHDDPLSSDDYNGGILTIDENMPADMPAHWSVYFHVADADATAAKATELGGSVVVPAMDTSAGRIAIVADPQGGVFTVIAPPDRS